jgi:ABC-2 type transport system ATP-binding protein
MNQDSRKSIIDARKLCFSYGKGPVIENVTFEVASGSIFGVLGKNASGKTTLLKLLTGILPPTSGETFLFDYNVHKEFHSTRGQFGIVLEETRPVRPYWRGIELLEYAARLYGLSQSAFRKRLTKINKTMEIPREMFQETIANLSAGNQKKIDIMRAVLPLPRLLFLDEPTKELDPLSRRRVWSFMKSLVSNQGMTVFLCSHDMTEVRYLCDEIVVLKNGQVAFSGPVPRSALSIEIRISPNLQKEVIEGLADTLFLSKVEHGENGLSFHSLNVSEMRRLMRILDKIAPRASLNLLASDELGNLSEYL